MSETPKPTGPDLRAGVPETQLAEGGMLVGHVDHKQVLLSRRGAEVFAIDSTCTHYGGPLGEGLMVGDTVRCPWHHACFSLRTGEAIAAPAINPVHCWRVERADSCLYVREQIGNSAARETAKSSATSVQRPAATPRSSGVAARPSERIVIVGGGAAGFAAAEMLRREGYTGALTITSADADPPYDRPNLSKDYLAGTAAEDWIPLKSADFYAGSDIDLKLGTTAVALDLPARRVIIANGDPLPYTQLLIATGAEPVRLQVPGADLPHVRTLRSLADCRQIIGSVKPGGRAVVVGASFIGLEGAAALRQRGVDVHVVAPEEHPFSRTLGPVLGDFIRALHEAHGVLFHLRHHVHSIDERGVQLDDGTRLEADLVLVGIGVRPRLELAAAGLATDHGILVNEYLETSAPGVYAAGDVARWPDPHTGERLRIEHWVVAERQGQTAARNMLGRSERFTAVPFFWTQHYDVSIDYVGHAASWDRIDQVGDPQSRDAAFRFCRNGRTLAVSTIFRGRESLEAELAMEQTVSARSKAR
jgi:NADPH-dependent 2,4-dienoyl-CoA reductase/sulfur reductase-like enzyme/nitrite reductase/ring-hydroxylating ferredoxin subunit